MKLWQPRERTDWTWRLKLYPIVVIPLMVYFVATAGPTLTAEASVQQPVEASGGQSAAAPLSGFHKGTAITCERRTEITFCWQLTEERR